MKPKEKGAEEVTPFLSAHNPNSPNIFLILRQVFENFQHSKTMSNVFSGKKRVRRQASDIYASNGGCRNCRKSWSLT